MKAESLPSVSNKNEVALASGGWGAAEAVAVDDLKLPRILLQQALSDLVNADKAKPGEFRDSIEGTLLGDDKKPCEIVIFDSFKTYTVMRKTPGKGKSEFVTIEPITPMNLKKPYEEPQADGSTLVNIKTWNYYCLIPGKDVKESLPYMLSLSRTGNGAARKLSLFFSRLSRMSRPSASVVIKLTSAKESNDMGTFYVPDVEISRDANKDELDTARYWYDSIRSAAVNVIADPISHDDDEIPF